MEYASDAKLLFTDTDSLCYDIKTEDFYQDMFTCKEQFDLSDMKIEKFKDSEYKKVVGKFKDETQGIPICEFIGLGLYSLKRYASYSYLFNQSYDAYLFSE